MCCCAVLCCVVLCCVVLRCVVFCFVLFGALQLERRGSTPKSVPSPSHPQNPPPKARFGHILALNGVFLALFPLARESGVTWQGNSKLAWEE